ncbi:MAG: hypothetical protein Q8P41_27000 [Pseudomonadota bacterium]|nr:hypothetical protein [Pseudomonadota bacterium]
MTASPPRRGPPRGASAVLRGVVVLLAAGCSDYTVARSELSADAESAELTLAEGGTAEVVLRLSADAEALAANPTSWVDITVFSVRVTGAPVVSAAAGGDSVEMPVTTIEYLPLLVDDPLRRCSEPDAEGPEALSGSDGSCVVLLPVTLAARAGSASVQVTAYYELDFGRQEPPGEIGLTIP